MHARLPICIGCTKIHLLLLMFHCDMKQGAPFLLATGTSIEKRQIFCGSPSIIQNLKINNSKCNNILSVIIYNSLSHTMKQLKYLKNVCGCNAFRANSLELYRLFFGSGMSQPIDNGVSKLFARITVGRVTSVGKWNIEVVLPHKKRDNSQ